MRLAQTPSLLIQSDSDEVLGPHRSRKGHEVIIERDGSRREYVAWERLYSLKELANMLRAAGLAVRGVWGDCDGNDYGLDSLRMIVLAQKAD